MDIPVASTVETPTNPLFQDKSVSKPESVAQINTLHPNGLTDIEIQTLLAAAGRRKDDPGYLERGRQAIADYGRTIQEETQRQLAQTESI